jgi:crotonobetainyl-CoA:carnitine CoA-transferase CaiB-like acyl-CoA transferase
MRFEGGDGALLIQLLSTLGLAPDDVGGSLQVMGDDPIVGGPHRTGRVAALALAAQAAAIAALWRQRGGAEQDIEIEVREAVIALNTLPFLRRNGHEAFHFNHDTDPLTSFFRAADGRWIFLVGTYPKLRDGTLRLLGCANDRTAIANAVMRWTGFALEDALAANGLVGAVVRTPEEWCAHPHGEHLLRKPVFEIERIGDTPPIPLPPALRPLDGVRVLDMTHVLAGPSACRALAEQGADVLHVASLRPELADPVAVTIETGMGKRSAIVDLHLVEDRATLLRLARDANVFVQSWRPGLLAGKGLSPHALAKARPGLIYVSVSAFGIDGPWGDRGGFDQVAQAAIGVSASEGAVDAPQWAPAGLLTDLLTGFFGAAAVGATLVRRAREGGSYHIKLSLAQTGMWVQSLGMQESPGTPRGLGTPRMESVDTAYGRVEYAASPIRYSHTQPRFDRPCVLVGASLPEWL